MKNNKKNKKKVPRNPFVVAMILRHKCSKMDRRVPKGGSKNHQQEYLSECK